MKRSFSPDFYLLKDQPSELPFVEDLKKPYHENPPKNFGKRKIENDEVSVDGLYLVKEFNDKKGLLETAYADFEFFTSLYKIGGKKFPVLIKQQETSCFEEYTVEVKEDEIIISANDTEGIRRGIYLLEDEIKASEGAFLKLGITHKIPYIKKRITRGFFSPTNRPPQNGDELSDDIDYYPEEYLNRLAHDGSNGIWIYTRFWDIIPSEVITESGVGYEKRIAKLNRVCDKCEKYGIGVYVFAIEPAPPKPGELREKYRALIGGGPSAPSFAVSVCTHTELGKKYCIDATKKLCEMAPKIAGYISITAGERATSCGANNVVHTCPYCGHKTRGASLGQTIDCLKEGIRQSGSKAEFISWTYGHRSWDYKDISDYIEASPDDVMLMQNFEDAGYAEQLGRERVAIDYWLSYPGPSQMFCHTAKEAKKHNKHLYAKMQICSSHELSTIPYIPTPGLVFEKFKGARECGVEGVMECWYFGNYPSIMSKAAGDLSFYDDFSDKDAFLLKLASSYCGRTNAPKLAEAWKHFEEGYKNYPINISFSYYGPMHDGICWKLRLIPRNFSLPRSWHLDLADGDRMWCALNGGHTPDEAITLISTMKQEYERALEILKDAEIPEEHRNVADALYVLCESALNILIFYRKREHLGLCEGDPNQLLSEMKEIVYKEMETSRKMITLCEKDTRLGYHSEAAGFKFFPKIILERIEALEDLLKTEFPEIENRVKQGLLPLEYYAGVEDDIPHYKLIHGDISKAEWVPLSDGINKFCASQDDENLYIKVTEGGWTVLTAEFQLFHLYPALHIGANAVDFIADTVIHTFSLFGEAAEKEISKWKHERCEDGILLTVNKKSVGWDGERPIKVRPSVGMGMWSVDEFSGGYLGEGNFGWFMPEKK